MKYRIVITQYEDNPDYENQWKERKAREERGYQANFTPVDPSWPSKTGYSDLSVLR